MVAKKKAGAKKSGKKKAASSATKKSSGRKTSGKKSGGSLLTKAKRTLKAVLAGAAEGAVTGAAEAGSKATGVVKTNGPVAKTDKITGAKTGKAKKR